MRAFHSCIDVSLHGSSTLQCSNMYFDQLWFEYHVFFFFFFLLILGLMDFAGSFIYLLDSCRSSNGHGFTSGF